MCAIVLSYRRREGRCWADLLPTSTSQPALVSAWRCWIHRMRWWPRISMMRETHQIVRSEEWRSTWLRPGWMKQNKTEYCHTCGYWHILLVNCNFTNFRCSFIFGIFGGQWFSPKLKRHLNAKISLSDRNNIHGHRNFNYTERSTIARHRNFNAPKICKITVL